MQAAKSTAKVSVHTRIARLAQLLVDATEARGYMLRPGECWGFACRPIAGTRVPSNHSWGLAVDINSPANPYTHPRVTDMPPWMPLLWNRYGFAWGGNYDNDGRTGKADSMHYEFMGTPADADAMTALALAELATTTPEDDVPWLAKDGAPPIHDYFPGAKTDLPDPATALAWATAHAGLAARDAAAAGEKVDALRADIAAGHLGSRARLRPARQSAAEAHGPAAVSAPARTVPGDRATPAGIRPASARPGAVELRRPRGSPRRASPGEGPLSRTGGGTAVRRDRGLPGLLLPGRLVLRRPASHR